MFKKMALLTEIWILFTYLLLSSQGSIFAQKCLRLGQPQLKALSHSLAPPPNTPTALSSSPSVIFHHTHYPR